jgi:hypothetical protein
MKTTIFPWNIDFLCPYRTFNRSSSVPIEMDKNVLLSFSFKELLRSTTIANVANKLTFTPFLKKGLRWLMCSYRSSLIL